MRILENGIYRDATKEELAEAAKRAEENVLPDITESERLEALEAAFMELAEVVLNG